MNVFVLGTGRCGTTTFVAACRHLTNFTADHESRARHYGEDRFTYPPDHIEADNRLGWFLPQLERAVADRDTFWVHLTRDREATARSFLKRLDTGHRSGIITAFAHAVVMRRQDWPEADRLGVCRFYVDTVNANIAHFLRDKPHLDLSLETMDEQFPAFLGRIGAEGDLDAALAEWSVSHNAS